MKKFSRKISGRFDRNDTWGLGFAFVPSSALVLAFGWWTVEFDWS